MKYEEALSRLHELYRFGIYEGLERITELLQRLGHPERSIPRFLHIAGTNGKGSCAAMLDSISRSAGLKTGLFTSPHLHQHTERYRIDGAEISREDFARVFRQVLTHIDAMTAEGRESPTEFEAATALALTWFAEQNVDMAVLEVGLGGGADSTNVMIPEISLITNVGLDHMAHLGNTVEAIAGKKAGIIKAGVPIITAAEGPALAVIEREAARLDAPLWVLGRDISSRVIRMDCQGTLLDVTVPGWTYRDLFLPLLGPYQVKNASLAVAVAAVAGFPPEAISLGLSRVTWPGRMEVLCREPLIVADGAHNAPGMTALAEAVGLYWPDKRILCLMGMLADKQREEALIPLLPLIERAIITPPNNPKRMGDWQRLADICKQGGVEAEAIADNRAACEKALALMEREGYDMLLVTGSLYLLADLRLILLDLSSEPGRK